MPRIKDASMVNTNATARLLPENESRVSVNRMPLPDTNTLPIIMPAAAQAMAMGIAVTIPSSIALRNSTRSIRVFRLRNVMTNREVIPQNADIITV